MWKINFIHVGSLRCHFQLVLKCQLPLWIKKQEVHYIRLKEKHKNGTEGFFWVGKVVLYSRLTLARPALSTTEHSCQSWDGGVRRKLPPLHPYAASSWLNKCALPQCDGQIVRPITFQVVPPLSKHFQRALYQMVVCQIYKCQIHLNEKLQTFSTRLAFIFLAVSLVACDVRVEVMFCKC